jgi:hypothetical protein
MGTAASAVRSSAARPYRTRSGLLVRQKLNQRSVKLFRTFFIRKMPNARKNNQPGIRKVLPQLLSRRRIHRGILTTPHEKRRNARQLRQSSLQLAQICRPRAHDAQRMLEQSRLRQRGHVTLQRSRWNQAAVAIHASVPIRIGKTHVPTRQPEQRPPKLAADKRRQPAPMCRIRIHRRHQHQPPHPRTRSTPQALRSCHHRDRAAMRSPQQIKRRDSEPLNEPQKPLRRPPHRMIKPGRTIREPSTHHVGCINRSVRCHCRHRKSPRKRISQQPMHQNQRPPGARPQIPHARPIQIHPALFNAPAQSRTGRCRVFPVCPSHKQILNSESSQSSDNSFPATGFYLSEHRLCSLHLGSSGSPFFPDPQHCHPERSERASEANRLAQSKDP